MPQLWNSTQATIAYTLFQVRTTKDNHYFFPIIRTLMSIINPYNTQRAICTNKFKQLYRGRWARTSFLPNLCPLMRILPRSLQVSFYMMHSTNIHNNNHFLIFIDQIAKTIRRFGVILNIHFSHKQNSHKFVRGLRRRIVFDHVTELTNQQQIFSE